MAELREDGVEHHPPIGIVFNAEHGQRLRRRGPRTAGIVRRRACSFRQSVTTTLSANRLPPPGLLATARSPPIALAMRLT